ncbi:hypothetical protein [Streptococcus orisratti]|uniref:hypothetical protein n=1 Tax=Streptococcus orisratti TaxID=114652 RepID=UPI0023F70F1C|nr:hypothetical protein [Streptococcus orisratti]
MFFYLVLIVGISLLVKLIIWTSDASPKSTDLQRALRYGEYNLSYSEKVANVVALGAKVVEDCSNVRIIVPTKGFWQLRTTPIVRQILKERIKAEIFQDFVKVNYSNVVFTTVQVEKNYLVMNGRKSNTFCRHHRL